METNERLPTREQGARPKFEFQPTRGRGRPRRGPQRQKQQRLDW